MQVAPPSGQICNQCEWLHLTANGSSCSYDQVFTLPTPQGRKVPKVSVQRFSFSRRWPEIGRFPRAAEHELLAKTPENEHELRAEKDGVVQDKIYIWKTMNELVPNCGIEWTEAKERRGRICLIPKPIKRPLQNLPNVLKWPGLTLFFISFSPSKWKKWRTGVVGRFLDFTFMKTLKYQMWRRNCGQYW